MAHRLARHYTVEVVCAGSEEKKMSGEHEVEETSHREQETGD